MNDHSLFAPAPRRKRGLILTLSGSLLFHGSLVGVAALWPVHPAKEPPPVISQVTLDGPAMPSEPLPAAIPPSEPDPAPPGLTAPEPPAEAPPIVETSPDDMTLATPMPRPITRTPSRPAPASSVTHPSRVPSNLAAGSASNGGAGHPGSSGQPGAGLRWNTPKPVYPAALRLAHVHGSGSVRVTTDGSGRVVSAAIVQSTGNALLDDNTCRAARNDWSGPPDATTTVPITYQLQ